MDKINLTLNGSTYNLIMQAIQEMPWRVANPIFQEIEPQVRAALAKEAVKEPPTPATPVVTE